MEGRSYIDLPESRGATGGVSEVFGREMATVNHQGSWMLQKMGKGG